MKEFNFIRFLKIISINFIIIIILYNICETTIFIIGLYKSYTFFSDKNRSFYSFCKDNYKSLKALSKKTFEQEYKVSEFRPVAKNKFSSSLPPILIFGCSFAYGSQLKNEETISYKLFEYTNRKVINRAQPGWGPQNMLYQVEREDFYNNVKEQPEYVIYISIESHFERTLRELFLYDNQTFYKWNVSEKQKKLTQSYFQSGKFYYTYTLRQIRYFLANKYEKNPNSKIFFMQHFIQSRDAMEQHWKKYNNNYKTKYIIFVYSYNDIEKEYLKEIEKNTNGNIKVILMEDITNENMYQEKYQLSDKDIHPNGAAWNHIVPRLVKKIGL